MNELPKGWTLAKLDFIGKWASGGTPKRTNPTYYGGDIPWLVIGDLNDSIVNASKNTITESGLANSSAKLVEPGTLLIAMYGSIGKLGIAGFTCSTNQAIASCVVKPEIVHNIYLFYLLMSCREHLLSLGKGGAQQNISQTVLKNYIVPLAPLNEQIRIANKLDSLLAKIQDTQTRLDKIPDILKRFRQSVLAAATSGKLTKWWRDETNETWFETKLDLVAEIKDPHPSHRTPKEVAGGVPYIGIGDINDNGKINFERARKVSYEVLDDHQKRYKLKEGDFIFGKIGTLGNATVLPIDNEYVLSANVILIQPDTTLVFPSFLRFLLSSPDTMKEIAKQSNSTSQAAFGIKKMRAFIVELPSKKEQQEIVSRVESLFALADKVEKQYQAAKQRTDRLNQSLLAKAFRGELVPQDPNDEPAAELLKRIQTEREALEKTKPQKRSARKSPVK